MNLRTALTFQILRRAGATAALLSASLTCANGEPAPLDLTGVWDAHATLESGSRDITWTFAPDGEAVTGTSVNQESGDKQTFDRISVNGNQATMEIDIERDGTTGVVKVVVEGTKPGHLAGSWTITGSDGTLYMNGDITATKEAEFAFAGTWESVAQLTNGEEHGSELTIVGENPDLRGSFKSENGTLAIDSTTADGENLELKFHLDLNGTSVPTSITGKPAGEDKLAGRWAVHDGDGNETASGEWSATRVETSPDLSGDWKVTATVPESDDYKGTLSLKQSGEAYEGHSTSEGGTSLDLKTVEFDGSGLVLTLQSEYEGQPMTIKVEADLQDDGSLSGKWHLSGGDSSNFGGDWNAVRGS